MQIMVLMMTKTEHILFFYKAWGYIFSSIFCLEGPGSQSCQEWVGVRIILTPPVR